MTSGLRFLGRNLRPTEGLGPVLGGCVRVLLPPPLWAPVRAERVLPEPEVVRRGAALSCASRCRIPGFSGFLCTWGFACDLSDSPVLPASSTLELSFFATQLKYHFPGNLTAFCSRSKLAAGFFHTSQRVSFSCSSFTAVHWLGRFALPFQLYPRV